MKRYYFYRLTCDTGNAPCVFELNYNKANFLTLACCKGGQLRYNKKCPVEMGLRKTVGEYFLNHPNDEVYVIGTLGDRFVYIAKINQVVPMVEYFSNSNNYKRLDCIYESRKKSKIIGNYEFKLKRRNYFNPYFHNDNDDQQLRDELGKYVLISNEFIYFGNNDKVKIPDSIYDKIPKRQETKMYEDCEKIENFIEKCFKNYTSNFCPTNKIDTNSPKCIKCQK